MKKRLSYFCLLLLAVISLSAAKNISEEYSLLAKPKECDIVIQVCNPNGTILSGADVYANGVYVGTSPDVFINVVEGTEVTITAYKEGYQMIETALSKTHFSGAETLTVGNLGCLFAFVFMAPLDNPN